LTRPLVYKSGAVHINALTAADGYVKAELMDAAELYSFWIGAR